jgi:hypothetical protein
MVNWPAVVGEFAGTFVLIVLGNGVVAGALLNKSKAQNAGWISITTGWAVAVFAGVAVSAALGDADGHLNPAFTVASVMMTGNPMRLFTYILRSCYSMASVQAALGTDRRRGYEVCLLCDRARGVSPGLELLQRSARDICAGAGGDCVILEARLPGWSCRGARTDARWRAGMGNWPLAGRNDGIRDQSGTRLRASRRSHRIADCRQGRLGLAICMGAHFWTIGRCRSGCCCSPCPEHVETTLYVARFLLRSTLRS